MDISEFIKKLKSDKGYQNWVLQFKNFVESKDRIPSSLKYFLVYDLDDKSYSIQSELQISYNTIVLKTATIPSKKSTESIKIEDYKW